MSIEFVCPNCNKPLRAPPEFAGRKARCKCGAVLVVPPLATQPPTATPLAGAPPAAAPKAVPKPSSASSIPTNAGARGPEPAQHSRPAAKLSPRAKLLAGKRTLVLGVGGGTAVVLLLALIVWMFSGPGGVSKNGGGVSGLAAGVSGPMRYLPNDCLLVATANIDELMSSSVYQQMKKDLPSLEDGERNLEQEIGIAPSNISRITLAVGGKANSNDAVVVLAIGLKTAMSAADVKSKNKVQPYLKDVKYEETQVGSVTLFEETYRLAGKAEREHGTAFCMPESTLIVECSKLDVLKKVVERGKPPDFSEAMQNAMSETDFSKTLAFAVNVKELVASENFMDEFKGLAGGPAQSGGSKGPNGVDERSLQSLLGLVVDASLDSSKATVRATLLFQDAKFAEDAKKTFEDGQVALRNNLKTMPGAPRELSDLVDAIKFSVSGAKLKGNVETSLEPLSKWIKGQTGKK
jgi:hypothetical protein